MRCQNIIRLIYFDTKIICIKYLVFSKSFLGLNQFRFFCFQNMRAEKQKREIKFEEISKRRNIEKKANFSQFLKVQLKAEQPTGISMDTAKINEISIQDQRQTKVEKYLRKYPNDKGKKGFILDSIVYPLSMAGSNSQRAKQNCGKMVLVKKPPFCTLDWNPKKPTDIAVLQ